MKCRFWKPFGTALVLFAAPAVTIGQAPFAAADDETAEGRIVEISPEAADEAPVAVDGEVVAAPKYWIGVQGRPIDSDALRTHLQLADDVGVLVESVVPGSPAEKAGLARHDVIVAVDGEPISELAALQKVVADRGDKKAITLKVIRVAKETTVEVTAAERPADAPVGVPADGLLGQGGVGPMGDVEALLRKLQEQGGGAGGVRVFAPAWFWEAKA